LYILVRRILPISDAIMVKACTEPPGAVHGPKKAPRVLSIRASTVRLWGKAAKGGRWRRHAMKYMFLLYGSDLPEPGTAEAVKLFEEWSTARQAMTDAGVLIDCAPLQPVAASTTVRVRDGETLLTDGPAAEIKEVFGGFTLIECDDLDEALGWAAKIPTARDGAVEVRPLVQTQVPA